MHVGPYEILKELGQGGMARVFLGRDPRSGREVAIKVLLEARASSPEYRTRFLREARALAKVEHPNVVRLLDVGEEQGTLYIVLPYHSEGSLADRLDRAGPLPIDEALQLGVELARGVQAAHALGVLHRDLKPDNVLLRDQGVAMLTDFGLAKDLGREGQTQDLTKSGTLQGTPGYWAPEQAAGIASGVGPHTDVYGLGAVLYAALSGRAPIVEAGLLAILAATLSQAPPPLRSFRDDVPRELEAVILRCLEKEPGARWASALEVEEALARCRAEPAQTGRTVAGLLTLTALTFGGGLVLALWEEDPPPAPSAAETPRTSPTSPQATPQPSSSPDMVAVEQVYLRARAEFDAGATTTALRLFAEAAEAGHPAALNALGVLHQSGRGLDADKALAASYFRRAADLGYGQAMANLGLIHQQSGLVADYVEARALFRRASEHELPEAWLSLGILVFEGVGGPKDEAEGLRWLHRAAEAGTLGAMRYLGVVYLKGQGGVPPDHAQGIEWLRRGAALEDPTCMHVLGMAYASGQGVPKDPSKSLLWLQRAADKGLDSALYNLAVLHQEGRGVPKNAARAADLYRRAADQGYPLAMFNLGVLLTRGEGVPQDDVEAARWFQRAADRGVAAAMFHLGLAFSKGVGVPQDLPLGAEWLRRGAEKGNRGAMLNLAVALMRGEGVSKDEALAFHWYQKAADQGSSRAMHNLATMLERGQGTPQDPARALSFYRAAAELGEPSSMLLLGRRLCLGSHVPKDLEAGVEWIRRAAASDDPEIQREAKRDLERLGR